MWANTYQYNLVDMGERDVVPLHTVLLSLKFMADNIRNESFISEKIKNQLKGCGYGYWLGCCPDQTQVMKALVVAVNEAIQERVEPIDQLSGTLNEQLYHLLAKDDEPRNFPYNYFHCKNDLPQSITSPVDLAEHYLSSYAPQWLVKNMIQRQFDIKWDTPTGQPDDYSFYEFCDMENTTKHFKYKPRLAHVKATLYKEFCRRPEERLYDVTKNVLCPTVYINTVGGWKTWSAYDEEHNEEGNFKNDYFADFSWIDKSIFEFIKQNADMQKSDDESLKQSLEKPTLYWLLIQDSEFMEGENLKLKPIGETQVYVGKANNGILGRWLRDSGSHCEMIKKCWDNVRAMTTYDPLRLEGIQLVDARLPLAKVRGEETACVLKAQTRHNIHLYRYHHTFCT